MPGTRPESSGSVALIAASRAGARLAARLAATWPGAEVYAVPRYLAEAGPGARPSGQPLAARVAELFESGRPLVFFLPVGAAVRLIAPCLRDKLLDPAVVAADDGGRFAVSLVSGHAGGGNALAEAVASALGAQAVITTAAEARGLPAPELIGLPFGWRLEASRAALLAVSSAFVNDRAVVVYQEPGLPRWLPRRADTLELDDLELLAAARPEAAIVISDRVLPSASTGWVVWRPRAIVAGLGCSTGAPVEELTALLEAALAEAGLARASVGLLATLDRKLAEPGLQELALRLGLELRGYRAEELATLEVPTPSEVVRQAVGTPSVAEAAALLASGRDRLSLPKRTSAHATVALARRRPAYRVEEDH